MKKRTAVMPKKQTAGAIPSGLTETEQDLLSHLQNGYQLQTDLLGGNPVLRRLKDGEVIRPLSATRNTVKALEDRGLIAPAKGDDPCGLGEPLRRPSSGGIERCRASRAAHRSVQAGSGQSHHH